MWNVPRNYANSLAEAVSHLKLSSYYLIAGKSEATIQAKRPNITTLKMAASLHINFGRGACAHELRKSLRNMAEGAKRK